MLTLLPLLGIRDGNNDNGERVARASFFDTDNDFRVPEFMHFVTRYERTEASRAMQIVF